MDDMEEKHTLAGLDESDARALLPRQSGVPLSSRDQSWLTAVNEFEKEVRQKISAENRELKLYVFSQAKSSLLSESFVSSLAARIEAFEKKMAAYIPRSAEEILHQRILSNSKNVLNQIAIVSWQIEKRLNRSVITVLASIGGAFCVYRTAQNIGWNAEWIPWTALLAGLVLFGVINIVGKLGSDYLFRIPEMPILDYHFDSIGCKISTNSHPDKFQVTNKLYENGALVGFRTALNTGRPSALLFGLAGAAILHAGAWLVNQATKPSQSQLAEEIWDAIEPVMRSSHERLGDLVSVSSRFLVEEGDIECDKYLEHLSGLLERMIKFQRSII